MIKKPYDPKLHDKARPAEKAAMAFLKRNNLIFGDPIFCGDTDPDRDAYSDLFDFEFEHRGNYWKTHEDKFPPITITIPERKRNRMKSYTIYFVIREDCKKALMLSGNDVFSGRKITKDTIYSTKEDFIEIDKGLAVYCQWKYALSMWETQAILNKIAKMDTRKQFYQKLEKIGSSCQEVL